MNDKQLIDLYWSRDESAIRESEARYGAYCHKVADSILHAAMDAEECVNDTWLHAWNAMPPARPNRLNLFFARITRNLALDRWRRQQSRRAGGGQVALCLDELSEVIGSNESFPERLELKTLLEEFLAGLPARQRTMFLLRYWYIQPVSAVAEQCQVSEGAVKMTLQRVREKLRAYLIEEGITL
ncbi:MAG: sigma-70 family RNA polymerase sigma factor [Oscillospiraceae bacterium]|nr:sigma-70 family RNA polymerase sigma factor [Oscillospiraceae bacterium]